MKNLLIISLALFSAGSYARLCKYELKDRVSGYVYESNTVRGTCAQASQKCGRIKRNRRIRGAKCESKELYSVPRSSRANKSWSAPRPRANRHTHLLNLSDYNVAMFALRGLAGSCQIERGEFGTNQCAYYVKVDGFGYPYGTDGCSSYRLPEPCATQSPLASAGCMVKRAIKKGLCR